MKQILKRTNPIYSNGNYSALEILQYVVLICFILYFGKTLFIPLSFSILISFILFPVCKWLEKKGDTVHDTRNKEELKKIKKQIKGYNFSKAELEKKNKEGMKLKDVLSKLWMGK